ncbi:MAG: hypothetical protein Roseis2KO_29330 [Roseivirga sp.]
MKRVLPYFIISLFILVSCGQGKQQTNTSAPEEAVSEEVVSDTTGEREPTDEEIREYGILTSIEDAPYPMFSIDVEFPEREMKMSFLFNVEESPLDMAELVEMEGKYATIYYIFEDDPRIEAIVRECEPIWGEIAQESNGGKEITGVLSGAESVSGDLPGTITITAQDGTKKDFKHFIDEAIVAANNEEVTVFYYEHGPGKITYLKASEN